MFIQTEATPNPSTLKFIPGVEVMKEDTISFPTKESAEKSPLATALFHTPHVKSVFFGSDFISVTKADDVEWDVIKAEILNTIMEHFVAGKPVLQAEGAASEGVDTQINEDDSDVVKQIKELIETRVRPAVAMDGGDIVFLDFNEETGVVKLELHGACSGCPSASYTLKEGIENMLRHYVPEVKEVEAEL